MRDKITKPVPGEADFVKGTINGVQYRIVRHPRMGHLNGYVKVPSMGFDGTYRDIEYVLAELRGLVSQMMPCSTAA